MRRTVTALIVLLAVLGGTAAHAADPKLARLSAVPANPMVFDVLFKAGAQAPHIAAVAGSWQLTAADPIAVRSNVRPDDRVIELYSGTPSSPILISRVLVRFHKDKNQKNWIPYFQLNEEPALMKVNGQWQPIQLAPGVPALLVQRGNLVPTAEGYVPTLEFGLASGALPIVGWIVR